MGIDVWTGFVLGFLLAQVIILRIRVAKLADQLTTLRRGMG